MNTRVQYIKENEKKGRFETRDLLDRRMVTEINYGS